MLKNILIISSNHTGHGHKSISEAIGEEFLKRNINTYIVDGFEFAGDFGLRVGKMYGTIVRWAKPIWKVLWNTSSSKHNSVSKLTEFFLEKRFLELIESINPDLIISVHPNFNGSILNILTSNNIKIPFMILIADLVSISALWADKRCDYIICPTLESQKICVDKFGIMPEKTKMIGFPVRSRFCKTLIHIRPMFDKNRPIRFLILSGGEGVGDMGNMAKIILRNYNSKVKIVVGRNKILKNKLITNLSKFGNRVEVFGFVENIDEMMMNSDILISRASPNVIMESIMCNLPIIITGALPGQEEGNPKFVEENNFGVVCKNINFLRNSIDSLIEFEGRKYKEIKVSQLKYRNPYINSEIVEFICRVLNEDKRFKKINDLISSKNIFQL